MIGTKRKTKPSHNSLMRLQRQGRRIEKLQGDNNNNWSRWNLNIQNKILLLFVLIFILGIFRKFDTTKVTQNLLWKMPTLIIDKKTASNNETKTATSTNNDDTEDLTDRHMSNNEIKMATTSTNHVKEDPTKMRLELLHIQKNAGTLLEVLASQHNISWGACHFIEAVITAGSKASRDTTTHKCPPVVNFPIRSKIGRGNYWHWPLQYMDVHHYDNIQDNEYVKRPKRFFAVIRNPYDRLISLFYYMNKSNKKLGFYNENNMDSYIQKILRDPKIVGLKYNNASQCQHHYVFDQNNTQMVDHVVQFEHLSEDFNLLSQTYGLNITIPKEMINVNRLGNEVQKMTFHNLTRTTRLLINSLCANDFQLLRGYPILN